MSDHLAVFDGPTKLDIIALVHKTENEISRRHGIILLKVVPCISTLLTPHKPCQRATDVEPKTIEVWTSEAPKPATSDDDCFAFRIFNRQPADMPEWFTKVAQPNRGKWRFIFFWNTRTEMGRLEPISS